MGAREMGVRDLAESEIQTHPRPLHTRTPKEAQVQISNRQVAHKGLQSSILRNLSAIFRGLGLAWVWVWLVIGLVGSGLIWFGLGLVCVLLGFQRVSKPPRRRPLPQGPESSELPCPTLITPDQALSTQPKRTPELLQAPLAPQVPQVAPSSPQASQPSS